MAYETEWGDREVDVLAWFAYLRHSDALWLGVSLFVGTATFLAYLLTHPYPAYGAGLYLEIAEQIRLNGYALPKTIPGYTADGVPFAYPPLLFVVAAVVRDLTGAGPFTYTLIVPGLVTVATLVPYYYIARELLATRARAGVSTVLFATAPPILQWHLSGGGIVRSPAFFLSLVGVYTGIKLFRTGDRRWLVPSTLLFALTVLSHPTYAAFFGVSYLLLYAVLDRSVGGLVDGAIVAGGGLLLVSPWLWTIVQLHGTDVFTAAAGTHGGLGGGVVEAINGLSWPPTGDEGSALVVLLAGGYLLSKRRVLLAVWTVATAALLADSRFLFVGGTMAAVVVLFDAVLLPARRRLRDSRGERTAAFAAVAFVGLVVVASTGVGVLFASSSLDTHAGSRSQPMFLDDSAVEATTWAETHTDPDAEFVVLGDAAEWFPYLSDRTILIGPWGVEWESADSYQRQLELFTQISTCEEAACVTAWLRESGYEPDYLYVPTGEYTVRGSVQQAPPSLQESLVASERYDLEYENEGVLVFRVQETTDRGRERAYRWSSGSSPASTAPPFAFDAD